MNDKNHSKRSRAIRYTVKIAILSALATILMLLDFPISFLAPSFYKFDFSEVVVMIGGFALGPVAALIIELVKNLLNLIINGSLTGGVGELANFIIGAAFTVSAANIYKYFKGIKGAAVSCVIGVITMASIGMIMNYFVLIPAYAAAFGTTTSTLTKFGDNVMSLGDFVAICVLPFNLFKGVVSSAITFILYKRVSGILHI